MFAFQVVSEQFKRTHLPTLAGTNRTTLCGKHSLLRRLFINHCRRQGRRIGSSVVTRTVRAFELINGFIVVHLGTVL